MRFLIDNDKFCYEIELKPKEYESRVLKTVEDRAVYAAECAIEWCHENDNSFPAILLVKAGKRKLYEVNTVPILLDLGHYKAAARVDKVMRGAIKKSWIIETL